MKILAALGVLSAIGGAVLILVSGNALMPPRRYADYELASIVAENTARAQLGMAVGWGLVIVGIAALVVALIIRYGGATARGSS